MAKCFQVVGQGVPVRMSDDDAFQVVERDHDGQYCSKRLFKDWPTVIGSSGTPMIARLVNGKISETGTLARNLQYARRPSDGPRSKKR